MSAIRVDNVTKTYRIFQEHNQDLKRRILRKRRATYDTFFAVRDVSFEVDQGEVFGIIGSNGSGKSTTLKLLAGTLEPDAGSVDVQGKVSALLELGAGFHSELTGRENVFLNGALLGIPKRILDAKLDELIEFSGLEEFIDNPIKTYSSGMYARLGFAVATNVDPDVLLIDEVLAVGDDAFQRKCLERIEELRDGGRTIVIVSHSIDLVRSLCSRAAWIDHGVLRALGPVAEVANEYQESVHGDSVQIEGVQHSGSGEVRLVSSSVTSPVGELSTGEPLDIALTVNSELPASETCFVGIRFRRSDGIICCGDDSRRLADMQLPPGQTEIVYHLDENPLLIGTYELEVAIFRQRDTHFFDHVVRANRFEVSRGHQMGQSGLFALTGSFAVNS